MTMASMMTAATTSLLVGLHLDGRDGMWEISHSPHNWLSMAAEQQGLQPRTINRANGYDLYDRDTWQRLRELRALHRPQRLWFSLPASKWCPWNSANYNDSEKRVKLETARRRERRLLWEVNSFIKDTLDADSNVMVYMEWPHSSGVWRQQPLMDLATHLEDQGVPWQSCRIDGCVYGMRDSSSGHFLKRPWTIRTNDEQFHRCYRAKVCPGNHGLHMDVSSSDEAVYYPWKMVQSIARHWCNQLAPQRHLHLVHRQDDLPALMDELDATVVEDGINGAPEDWCDDDVETGDDELLLNVTETQRLLVESMAREARLRQEFSMDTCEALLMELAQHITSPQPHHQRWPSRKDKDQPRHVVLGGYSHGGFGGVTRASSKFGEVTKYLNSYFRHHLPQHAWTSVMVTFNGRALPHRDHHNLPNTTNALHCLGNFNGGGLWIGQPLPNEPVVKRRGPDGSLLKGHVQPVRRKFVFFKPSVMHATQPWQGFRISMSLYTTRLLPQFDEESLRQLTALGFPAKLPHVMNEVLPVVETVKEMDPTANPETQITDAERDRWEAQVAKFHRAAGHPTNRNLARIIKDAGHEDWKVQVAMNYKCPACLSLKPGGTSSGQVPPASTQSLFAAWEAVGVDSGEWIPPGSKTKVKFLLFMDLATKLRVVKPLFIYDFLQMKAESGDDLIKGLAERWLGIFPKPRLLVMDSAKSFVSDAVHEFANSMNIMLSFVAEKEAWANGIIEAGVQDLKMTASAIHLEAMDQDPFVTLYLSTSALNSTEYVAGYSSFQWAYGKEYNLTDEDVRTLTASEFKGEYSKLV